MIHVQKIDLITVNDEKFISITTSDLRDTEERTFVVHYEDQLKTLPCRKLPLAINDRVIKELNKLVPCSSNHIDRWLW